jgi:diguanylate cyclase (GGDEF)-like protein
VAIDMTLATKARLPVVIVASSLVAYVALFLLLGPRMGRSAPILTVIPIITAAIVLGTWRGLAVATVLAFVSTPILDAFCNFDGDLGEVLTADYLVGNAPGIIASYAFTVVLGTLRSMNLEIRDLNAELSHLSRTDHLTSLPNRRAIIETMTKELLRAKRSKKDLAAFGDITAPAAVHTAENVGFKQSRTLEDYVGVFSCAILDVDLFKTVNDTFGHLTGDAVLRQIAAMLADTTHIRGSDVVGRYGGEEFLLLFPDTSSRNAMYAAAKLGNRVAQHEFAHGDQKFNVTVSIGISQSRDDDAGIDDILKRADIALYHAKANGRNRIVVFETDLAPLADMPSTA